MATLQDLVDDAAFAHADAALALRAAVGAAEPRIDLAAGTAAFDTPLGARRFRIQVLGSDDAAPWGGPEALPGAGSGGTWEWAWSRPGLVPTPLLALAGAVREVGARESILPLAKPVVTLDDLDPAHLVVAAKALAGRVASIVVPGAPGVHVHLVLDGLGGAGAPGARHAQDAITAALEQGLVVDHRRALRAYARSASLDLDLDTPRLARLRTPDGTLEVAFDADDRIERLTVDEAGRVAAVEAPPPWVGAAPPLDPPRAGVVSSTAPRGAPRAPHTPRIIRIGDMPRLSPAPPLPVPRVPPAPPGFGIPPLPPHPAGCVDLAGPTANIGDAWLTSPAPTSSISPASRASTSPTPRSPT